MNKFIIEFFNSYFIKVKMYFWFVMIISFLVIFHRLGEAPLGGDDCYFSEKAKEMARTGDYLTLKYGYAINFDNKPPFIFWMNSFVGKILGFNNFSMRLGSAVLCWICVVLTFWFTKYIFGSVEAFLSSIVLTFTQQYLYHARSAVTDGPLAVFISFAMFCFWVAYAKKKPILYYLMGLFTGLAVMTKQINGFFVYAIIVVFIILTRNYKILINPHFYGGIIVSFIIFLPWHIWSIVVHGMPFVTSYFGSIFSFVFKGIENRASDPWYEYIRKIVENYWPWFPFLIASILYEIKNILYKKIGSEEIRKKVFLLTWSFIPLFILQLGKIKTTQNLTPIYIPFSILTSLFLKRINENTAGKVVKWIVLLTSVVTIIFLLTPIIPKTMDSREYVEYMPLIDSVKKISSVVYTLKHTFWYFSNATWFYADRRVIGLTEDELINKLFLNKKSYFLLFTDDFYRLKRRFSSKIKILKASKRIVLFTNLYDEN